MVHRPMLLLYQTPTVLGSYGVLELSALKLCVTIRIALGSPLANGWSMVVMWPLMLALLARWMNTGPAEPTPAPATRIAPSPRKSSVVAVPWIMTPFCARTANWLLTVEAKSAF